MRLFAFLFLLAWVLGVVAGVWQKLLLEVAVIVLMGAIAWLARMRMQYVAAVLLLASLGGVYAMNYGDRDQAGCRINDWAEGRVEKWPDVRANDIRLVVRIESCRVMAYISRHIEVKKGDIVRMSGGDMQTLDEVRSFSKGYAEYLGRQGVSLVWRYPDIQIVQAKNSWTQHVRKWVSARIMKLFTEPDASLVQALLLAQRGTLPERWTNQFRATGVSHLLAVSGLHVTIITGLVVGMILLLPVRPWLRALLAVSLLWAYVWVIGMPVSAVRATSFWTITLLALRLHRLVNLPTVFMATAVVMLTTSPQLAAEVGFQLSMSAVAGIFLALFLTRKFLHRQEDVRGWLWPLAAVSAGAFLGTVPLVAYHFGNIALISVAANILVVPVVPLVLGLAILSLAVSTLSFPLALGVGLIVHGFINWMDFVTGSLARIPFVFVEKIKAPLWLIFVYYGILALVCVYILHRQGRSWREVWG